MAKVKYDVSNVEKRTFEVPKPGVYEAAIREMTHKESSSGNPMFEIVFEITKGDYKSSRIWYYILTDGSQEWRMREFVEACGLKTKGTIDTDALKGVVVQLRTDIDPAREGYDEKARVKNVLPAKGTSAGGGGEDDEEDDAPYEEWEQSELAEEVEARGLKITGKKTKKKLIDALEANDAEEGEGDDEEEEEEDEEEEDEDSLTRADLDKMSRTELKKLIAEEELEIKVMKKTTEEQLRDKIAEALELDEEEEEGEEEEDDEKEDTNYDEWEMSDLKATLKERGLKPEGRKSVLVARLQKDDASGDEPF